MSNESNTVKNNVERHGKALKALVYPYLVLQAIGHLKKASSTEIIEYIDGLAGKQIAYQKNSYYRLMSSFEHELGLIEPVDFIKDKGPARVYYGLTPTGRQTLDALNKEIYQPLKKLLS